MSITRGDKREPDVTVMGRRRRFNNRGSEDDSNHEITQVISTNKYDSQIRQTNPSARQMCDAIDNVTVHPNRNTTQGIEAATPQEGSGVDLQMKDTDYDPVSGVSDDHLYYANQSGEDNSPELDNTVVTRVRENSIGLHGDGTAKYEEPRIGRSSATNYRNRMDCYQGRTET